MASDKDESNKNAQKSKKEELPKLLEFKTSSSHSTKYIYVGKRPYNQLNGGAARVNNSSRNSSRNIKQAEQSQNIQTPDGYISDGFIYFNITNGSHGQVADVYQVFKAVKEQVANVAPAILAPEAVVAAQGQTKVEESTLLSTPAVANEAAASETKASEVSNAEEVTKVIEVEKTSEVSKPQEVVAKAESKVRKHRHHHHHNQYHQHHYRQPQQLIPQMYPQQYYQPSELSYASQYQTQPRHQVPPSRIIDSYSHQQPHPAQAYQAQGAIYGPQYNQYAAYQQRYYYHPQVVQNSNQLVNSSGLVRKETERKKTKENRKKENVSSTSKLTTAAVATAVAISTMKEEKPVSVETIQKPVEATNSNETAELPDIVKLEQKLTEFTVVSA